MNYVEILVRHPDLPIALTEVITGPRQDPVVARQTLEALLLEVGYGGDGAALPAVSHSGTTIANTSV